MLTVAVSNLQQVYHWYAWQLSHRLPYKIHTQTLCRSSTIKNHKQMNSRLPRQKHQRNSSSCHAARAKKYTLAHSRAIGNASVADSFSLAWLLVVILSPEWKPSACSVFKRDAVDCSDAMRSGEVSAQSQSPLRRCVFCWIFFVIYSFFISLPPPSLSLVFRGWTTSQDVYGGRRSSQRTCVVI